MKFITVSTLKKNAGNLNLETPICVTQNGLPTYNVESYESRLRRDMLIKKLKAKMK